MKIFGKLSFRISKIGRWWGKINKTIPTNSGKEKLIATDSEIDIVALDVNSMNYILGECKFRKRRSDLERLKEKSAVVKKGAHIQYALFTKSGFTAGLTKKAKADENVQLYLLSDIVNGKDS